MWIFPQRKSGKAVRAVSDYPMGFHLSRSYGVLSRKPQTPYLAYGSNLSIERMRSRCPDAEAIGRAMIPGYRLLFKKSQSGFYATIEQDANCAVPVLAYLISDYDEALLDRCEGYPRHYYKRYFQLPIVRLDTGKRMKEIQAVNNVRKAAIANGMSLEQSMTMWKTMEDVEKRPLK